MKRLADTGDGAAEAVMEQYLRFMQSEEYTQRVTDDLTLVAVVSPKRMAKSKQPEFNLEIYTTIAQESMNAKRRALNHRAAQEAGQTARMPALPAEPEEAPEEALPPEEPDSSGEDAPFFPQPPGMRGRKTKSSGKKSPWRFWPW